MSFTAIEKCQSCDDPNLRPVFNAGWLPLPNVMQKIGEPSRGQLFYPAQLLECMNCRLVQLGYQVDKGMNFPEDYAYRSGTTKILRDNFQDLCDETLRLFNPSKDSYVVDIGGNDGLLLSNFQKAGYDVYNIEPTGAYKDSTDRGIPTFNNFFDTWAVKGILNKLENKKAGVVTCTNCFAHMPDIHEVMKNINNLLGFGGLFITESHYLPSLIEGFQYDTVYSEHSRYYSLTSLQNLLKKHGFHIVHAKKIPTHGGSIRVYAMREGHGDYCFPEKDKILASEEEWYKADWWLGFQQAVTWSKYKLLSLLNEIKYFKGIATPRIFGIGAPSRATTLIHYLGLDENILEMVLEVQDSPKVGKYVPGTSIRIMDERWLNIFKPEYAMILSWHIADELMPKLREKGFQGKFIIPLPEPKIVE